MVGTYLIGQRMALLGDVVAHAVLPVGDRHRLLMGAQSLYPMGPMGNFSRHFLMVLCDIFRLDAKAE